ncbi:MAG: DeoR/GlpR transcriptional regulator [Firmicutes bacterium]|nr:DeoR/GlpR transcriptional regulator [Bacillota bacterium]
MLPAERRQLIVDLITEHGSASVEQLMEATGASSATIRRDLDRLASLGLVSRTHGGAVLPRNSTTYERLYPEKRNINTKEKQRIGRVAAQLVADGESLILDSGSTTLEVAKNLTGKKNLTIITNDLFIATEIQYDPSTQVMVTGGALRPGFNVLYGSIAEAFLSSVNVDKVFLSGDAVDFERGLTNATFDEAAIKKLMIRAGREVYLVVDHSKFGKVVMAKVADLRQFKSIITDSKLSETDQRELKRLGIAYTMA